MRRRFLGLSLAVLAVSGCDTCLREEEGTKTVEDDDCRVEVKLEFRGRTATKSSFPGTGNDIDNLRLWVFRDGGIEQCRTYNVGDSEESDDGIGEDDSLGDDDGLGDNDSLGGNAGLGAGEIFDGGGLTLSLVKGHRYSIYALANVYRDFEKEGYDADGTALADMTEDDFKVMQMKWEDFGIERNGGSFPMAASLEGLYPKNSSSLTLIMERLVSRVVFRFAPDVGMIGQNAKIGSVVLKNAAMDIRPFVGDSCAETTADGDKAGQGDILAVNRGDSLIFYCLENCCGISDNSVSRLKFPEGAPYGTPSYIEAKVSLDGFGMSGDVLYRFCLGANSYNDYNLRRDYSYSVTLKSLYDSVDAGCDDWQIWTGDVLKGDGTPIGLYVGQFRRFKLSLGDEVMYYDDASSKWVYFINYSDDDYYSVTLPNGLCLITYYSEEDGSSCNPDFYVYSTARCSDDTSLLKIKHADGSEDKYTIYAPFVPEGFDSCEEISVCEDGYQRHIASIAVDGRLGTVNASEFGIPEHYLYADLPYSSSSSACQAGVTGKGYISFGTFPLPDFLMEIWLDSFDSASKAKTALSASRVWTLFDELYISGGETDSDFDSYAGFYADYLNTPSNPKLVFYGKSALTAQGMYIVNNVFSSLSLLEVTEAFPSQGALGECFNLEFMPDESQSVYGMSLPSGISAKASWSYSDDVCAYVSEGVLCFNFPLGSKAVRRPAGGELGLEGTVTNPFTGETFTGDYSVDVVLCLPLIASEKVLEGGTNSCTVGATAAVATDSRFHDNSSVWEEVFQRIFLKRYGCSASLTMGAEQTLVCPYPDSEDAVFSVQTGVDISSYTPDFLARYVAVNLAGFTAGSSTNVRRSIDYYPSASSEMSSLLQSAPDPIYARLVLFEDVNTQITPAVNVYGQGVKIYECLWGKRW